MIELCTEALQIDPNNVKALYRRYDAIDIHNILSNLTLRWFYWDPS